LIHTPAKGQGVEQGEAAAALFLSKVVGPHFERLCREWVEWHADLRTFYGRSAKAGQAVVKAFWY
jgi:hypothetical protein